jgi:hypothetical protein
MKGITVAAALMAAVTLTAGAVAKPDNDDQQDAQKQCKAERGKTSATREAFKARYHSMSRCVREKAKSTAAKQCAADRRTMGRERFVDKYGTNRNKRNAFGKCVSRKAIGS